MEEKNRVIAEFMGLPITETVYQYNEAITRNINYDFHRSWDLLMGVIEKIERSNFGDYEFNFSITGDGISISKFDDGSGLICQILNKWGESKLSATYKCVIEFITWYNTQPQ